MGHIGASCTSRMCRLRDEPARLFHLKLEALPVAAAARVAQDYPHENEARRARRLPGVFAERHREVIFDPSRVIVVEVAARREPAHAHRLMSQRELTGRGIDIAVALGAGATDW